MKVLHSPSKRGAFKGEIRQFGTLSWNSFILSAGNANLYKYSILDQPNIGVFLFSVKDGQGESDGLRY